MQAIETITRHAKKIASGKAKIHPGQPFRISEAATVGDGVAQGDLHLVIVDKVPADYVKAEKPSVQLVPGVTQGSRHCLDSLKGVTIYLPKGFPESAEENLLGPCLVLAKERTVGHPTHGAVTIPAGFTVQCTYQPEWDSIMKRQRRNAD